VLDDAEGFAMARYFFHIKDGAELIQDPEGSELATMEDARSQALKSARELWADVIGRSTVIEQNQRRLSGPPRV
jgi:hypothetical protein